jgi:peptidoglycan hydrolase-like protein with peptidoglycan-binding domain
MEDYPMGMPVQSSGPKPVAVSQTQPPAPEPKSLESSPTSNPAPPTTTNDVGAADKKAEHSIRGAQIAADLEKKVNPNAPPLEYIEKGGAVARQGQSGDGVTTIKRALNSDGAKPPLDESSNKYDAQTEAAVREYQKKNGLPVDGRVGEETLKHLLPNADSVEKDPRFAKLDPSVRKDIADSIRKSPNDYEARAGLKEVATAPGFDKLAPKQQHEMLDILKNAPENKWLAEDLRKLAGSESFRKLDPSIQSHGLAQINNHARNSNARATITKLQTMPGFQKLDTKEQERLLTLVGGENKLISKPARNALAEKMDSWTPGGDADVQAKELKTFLKEQKWTDWQTPVDAWKGRTTTPDSVSGPVKVDSGPFRMSSGPADKYSVKYGSKDIDVYVPHGTKKEEVDKLISTMNALPKANRGLIKEVIMEFQNDTSQNPAPLFDAKDGTIRAYPDGMALEPPDRRMSAMIHESAHLIDTRMQTTEGPKWDQDWKQAMNDDKLIASQYGKKSDAEDFAEVYLLYKLSENNKTQHDEYRRMYPNRFRLIDDIEKRANKGTL